MAGLSWAETKTLIVEAVELGAESTDEILHYLQGQGSSVRSTATVASYLARAVKEGAILSASYENTAWRCAPLSDGGLRGEAMEHARNQRREGYAKLRGWAE